MVENTTIAPNASNQAFVVDAWIAGKFGLDVPKYLTAAASTVEQLKGPLKAIIIKERQVAVTSKDIVGVLEGRGWEAEIMTEVVTESDPGILIPVSEKGLMKCVDGRPSDHSGMDGPKTLGGVYALATMRGVTTLGELKDIVKEVSEAGHIPSVHGDEHAHPGGMGCGFFKLWSQGKFEGIPPPKFDSEEGKAAIIEAGGVYETLSGNHEEKVVYINMVENTTIAPNASNQAFVVDAWIAGKFGLDVPKYLTAAASTVEQLKGPLKAIIIKERQVAVTSKDIVGVLEGRGWEAEIVNEVVTESHPGILIPVSEKGLMKCVDGRPSDHSGMDGPKTLGGVYALATMRGVTTLAELKGIVKEVLKSGHIPSVHGDEHANPGGMGCGFFKLWSQGKFEGIPPPKFDSEV